MGKVLSFGEILLRISPDANGDWLNANTLPFYVGGAEANVATALARWKVPTKYMTALPDNSMTVDMVDYLRQLQIDTSPIQFMGSRIGIYYLTQGADLKNAGVIYDRNHSSFSELKTGTIDWDTILADVSWLHFSAICPAINESVAEVCEEMLQKASEKKIQISLDLNYRSKLWKYGKDPIDIMPKLAKYCNLIMGNIWAANMMLGIEIDEKLIKDKDKPSLLEHALRTSEAIINRFPACTAVANTFRFDQQEGIRYFSTLYTEGKLICSNEYHAEKIVDKIGSGDCYMAGLIYGFYHNKPIEETLEFATAAAFNKLFIISDATNSTVEDINKTIQTYAI